MNTVSKLRNSAHENEPGASRKRPTISVSLPQRWGQGNSDSRKVIFLAGNLYCHNCSSRRRLPHHTRYGLRPCPGRAIRGTKDCFPPLSLCALAVPDSPEREHIARRHGFKTFSGLLAASRPLPMLHEDVAQSYAARHPNGYWFIWTDVVKEIPSDERHVID